MFRYHIDPDSDTPIYRQLVDQINAQIRSGALPTGTQLPTVRELAQKLQLSCGTVKHVYDCLQEMGDIEMTRRRGTFVKYVRKDRDSRKQQAMNAIDLMIRRLSELNFSPAEIQIFLNLKMREWGLKWSGVRITMVTEHTELAAVFQKQLSRIANAQINVCPLRQLREYPYSVDEQSDVILSSAADSEPLSHLLPDPGKLIRVALQTDPASLISLDRFSGRRLGVLCEGEAFAALVQQHLPPQGSGFLYRLAPNQESWDAAEVLIVAEGYSEQCGEDCRQRIASFALSKPVLTFACRLDEGSMLYLEERISRIRDERQQWPAALQR